MPSGCTSPRSMATYGIIWVPKPGVTRQKLRRDASAYRNGRWQPEKHFIIFSQISQRMIGTETPPPPNKTVQGKYRLGSLDGGKNEPLLIPSRTGNLWQSVRLICNGILSLTMPGPWKKQKHELLSLCGGCTAAAEDWTSCEVSLSWEAASESCQCRDVACASQ